MSIELVHARLRDTLELSDALARRSEALRRSCSELGAEALETITTGALHPDRVQSALTRIRTVNEALARAAHDLHPDKVVGARTRVVRRERSGAQAEPGGPAGEPEPAGSRARSSPETDPEARRLPPGRIVHSTWRGGARPTETLALQSGGLPRVIRIVWRRVDDEWQARVIDLADASAAEQSPEGPTD